MLGMRLHHNQEGQHEKSQDEPPTEREIQMSILQFLIGFPSSRSPPFQIRTSSQLEIIGNSGSHPGN